MTNRTRNHQRRAVREALTDLNDLIQNPGARPAFSRPRIRDEARRVVRRKVAAAAATREPPNDPRRAAETNAEYALQRGRARHWSGDARRLASLPRDRRGRGS